MINIQLHKFEGPLELLLYLIRKEEMDIMDIKIHEITKQYMEYIKLMQELDLDVAGEFITMASTLIHIKSKMLLPQYDENGEIIETEDPRKELVQRLLEYQKYQEAAKSLYERPLLGRDIFARGIREKLEAKEEEIVLEENALFALISAYRHALRAIKKKIHQVAERTQSIAQRILEMKEKLILGQRVALSDFISQIENKRRQILITFLSILELGKMGFVSIYQTENFAEIYVQALKPIESDVISKVEEYDSMNAEEVAAQLMEKSKTVNTDEEFFAAMDEQMDLDLAAEKTSEEIAESFEEVATDEDILAAEQEEGETLKDGQV